jgi:hypothetical protein
MAVADRGADMPRRWVRNAVRGSVVGRDVEPFEAVEKLHAPRPSSAELLAIE